ncbi:MAG: hypothetical protein FWD73_01675 [Polyangiaceae bacterium]|nr:hypothetical protein [Polyangiaceae bacterium]
MNFSRTTVRTLLFAAAATLFAAGAWAQPRDNQPGRRDNAAQSPPGRGPAAAPGPGRGPAAAPPGPGRGGPAAPPGRGGVVVAPPPGRGGVVVVPHPGPAYRRVDDRAIRRAREQLEIRRTIAAQWKGPPNEFLRKELHTHADRIARLQRIKWLAESEGDRVSAIKAAQLIDRENARHNRWMTTYGPRGGLR